MNETLVTVENVSKKFCTSTKQSMIYSLQDIAKSICGIQQHNERLKKHEFLAIDNISFKLKRGQCLGLIGKNGSGKSTLLKILNGIIAPDKGRVTIKGKIGALLEVGAGFHPMLTGRENIYINGAILGFTKKEIDRKFDSIVEFAELDQFIDTPVKHYSSGMYIRLGFAIAVQMEPDVLLIDEILAVGDLGFRSKCFNAINRIISNAAVIFVSHSMPDVNRICSDLCVLSHGKAIFQGSDVPSGIDIYLSSLDKEKYQIFDTGKAKVHSIILESNGTAIKDSINFLDELNVHIEVTIAKSIKHPSIAINFINQSLQIVAQCHSYYQKFTIKNNGGKMRISIYMGKINLNPGLYNIHLSIQDDCREVLVRHLNFRTLKIKGDFFGQAPVQINADWDVRQIDNNT